MRKHRGKGDVTVRDLAVAAPGLLAAAGFLVEEVAGWAVLAFFVGVVVRLLSEIRGWPLPSKPVKLLILAGGVAMVTVDYGKVLGLEPGLATVLLLVALKVLETTSGRDYQVVILLGYFLALCDLLFLQDLAHSMTVAGIVVLLTIALIRFQQRSSLARAAWTALGMAAEALPIILLLFLFFPRVSGGFRAPFSETFRSSSGVSDHLEPGSVASLALDNHVAFRASFPDGDVPAESELYWRGIVLWKCDGLTWNRGAAPESGYPPPLGGKGIRQSIVIEPTSSPWLFALDRARSPQEAQVGAPPEAQYDPACCLRSVHPINQKLFYEVESCPLNLEDSLDVNDRAAALQTPRHLSAEVLKLVGGWRSGRASDEQVITRALSFFRQGKFSYSLKPSAYPNPETALDEFLFQRRVGFCEHYAAAFGTLMRAAGIPTRIVVGYLGGEVQLGYVEVSQADAHAWCEVWKKGAGWERIDPTSAIAPERVNEGLESYLESQSAKAGAQNIFGRFSDVRRILDGAHLFWANLTFQWDMHVLNYNEKQQHAFLAGVGLGNWQYRQIFVGLVVAVLAFLAALALWLARPPRSPRDPAVKWWDRFCDTLAAAGAPRAPAEGPLRFTARAAQHFPADAEPILEAGRMYTELRYGRTPPPVAQFIRVVRGIRPSSGKTLEPQAARR
jgi:protein-glutamine gamma-glutamyltransferase